jgi:hypothetical protein
MGNIFTAVFWTYGAVGATMTSVSILSCGAYYSWGPGAFWNIGFFPWLFGGVIGLFSAMLRMLTWPYGLYILITNPDGFFPWLFYLWYS